MIYEWPQVTVIKSQRLCTKVSWSESILSVLKRYIIHFVTYMFMKFVVPWPVVSLLCLKNPRVACPTLTDRWLNIKHIFKSTDGVPNEAARSYDRACECVFVRLWVCVGVGNFQSAAARGVRGGPRRAHLMDAEPATCCSAAPAPRRPTAPLYPASVFFWRPEWPATVQHKLLQCAGLTSWEQIQLEGAGEWQLSKSCSCFRH